MPPSPSRKNLPNVQKEVGVGWGGGGVIGVLKNVKNRYITNKTRTAGPEPMSPSPWKLYLDDFSSFLVLL